MKRFTAPWRKLLGSAVLLTTVSGCGGFWAPRPLQIPDRYPVGSIERSHFGVMQTNGEASDFILHRYHFVGETSELAPEGKDRIQEIAARMRSAPFPVLVERSENNSNPQLDAERRQVTAMILHELGNADADQRTLVSPAYSLGMRPIESQFDYYRFLSTRGIGTQNGGGNFGGGTGGGFGGGFR